MKKIIILIIILFCLNHYASGNNYTSGVSLFLVLPPDARWSAIGEAGAAIVDDVSAIFWNPSGLVRLKKIEFIFSHAEYLMDLNYNFIAIGFSAGKWGSFGIGSYYLGVTPFDSYNDSGDIREEPNRFENDALSITYARDIMGFGAGLNCKYVSQNLSHRIYHYSALDAGIHRENIIAKNLSLALTARNMGPLMANIKIEDNLPFQIDFSAGYINKYSNLIKSKSAIDVKYPGYSYNANYPDRANINYCLGHEIEIPLSEELVAYPRLGLKLPFEYDFLRNFTYGMGIRFQNYNIDFSYLDYRDLQSIIKISLLLKL